MYDVPTHLYRLYGDRGKRPIKELKGSPRLAPCKIYSGNNSRLKFLEQ